MPSDCKPTDTFSLSKPLVLVDGACALCHRFSQWLLRADKRSRFLLGAWQDERVVGLMASRGMQPPFPDAIGLVDKQGRVYFADEAIWRICGALPWPWFLLGAIRIFPAKVRNFTYRWIAQHRYAWFGKLPSDQLHGRFPEDALW